jgi:hypothetical protein
MGSWWPIWGYDSHRKNTLGAAIPGAAKYG